MKLLMDRLKKQYSNVSFEILLNRYLLFANCLNLVLNKFPRFNTEFILFLLATGGMAWIIPDQVLVTGESNSLRLINLVDEVVTTVCPCE